MRERQGARRRRIRCGMLAVAVLFAAACGGGGAAGTSGGDSGKAAFEGETVHFVVSFGTGGGYDTVARGIAPYLEEELGATVVVENVDGAGGLLAASQIFAGEPDGLTFGFFAGQGIAGATLGGAEGVQFDLGKFSYITRLAADARVLIADPNGEYKTIEDIRAGTGVRFASAGVGAADNLDAAVLYPTLGIDGRVVTGYEGSKETGLAITSGDVNIGSGSLSGRMSGITGGDFRPVLIIGDEPVEELPDVPVLADLDLEDQNKELAEAHIRLQKMGRMVWAPPGVPEDRRAALEAAFKVASENPEFLAAMEKAEQEIEFTPGAEAKAAAEAVLNAPDQYKSLLEGAYEGQ